MNKEVSSDRQIISMMTLYLLGNTLFGIGHMAKQDVWVSVLISISLIAPVYALYARIITLYPGYYLFEIMDEVFTPIISRLLTFFFSFYYFLTAAAITRTFSEFIHIDALPETPDIVSLVMMGLVIIYAIKNGMEVLGRWAQLFNYILLGVVFAVSILSLTNANLENLRPLLYNDIKPVLQVAIQGFFFSFGELVVFLSAVSFSKDRNKPYRVYFYSLLIGGGFVVLVVLRNLLVLGPQLVEQTHFTSYNVVGLIRIGKFLQRIESSVAMVFILAGFIKTAVCMFAALKGFQHIFRLEHYRPVAAPFGLLLIITCRLIFKDMMQIVDFLNYYNAFYSFPFQLLLPVAVWIAAEIKHKKKIQVTSATSSEG
ncbi:MAG TPA: hypothetical protein DDZ89_16800 [Clostridiales bacterium]|nr:hypothetical protein [Clostridiales bacterium]